jgi:TonB family protein
MFRRLATLVAVAVITVVGAPSVAGAQAGVVEPEELQSQPRLVSAPAAARLISRTYPEALRRAGTPGTVQLQFVVGLDGKAEPGSIEADASLPAFESAARQVVQGVEFAPGKKAGQNVRARMVMTLVYKP